MDNHPGSPTSPFDLTDEEGYFWLKGNLHCHTTNSDGLEEPQARVDGYSERGYDFLALTDHAQITWIDTLRCPSDFTLIQGAELHPANLSGGQGHHFVVLNIREMIDVSAYSATEVIDAARSQGASVWLAHPYWSSVNIIRDTLPIAGLAGLEVYNTTCQTIGGRGESSVHWDDWMDLTGQIRPAIATDDAHFPGSDGRDTYGGWSMVRVTERSAGAIISALESGAAYSSNGPAIHDIQIQVAADTEDNGTAHRRQYEATIRTSPVVRIVAVCDAWGSEYRGDGSAFTTATIPVRSHANWVRFEVVDATGAKAWSNPFDLTVLEENV